MSIYLYPTDVEPKHNATAAELQQVVANLSSSFGWTLAGSAVTSDELDVTCANITETGHGKWAAQGLMPSYIVEPVCNQSHSSPNATLALPWTVYYNTRVFTAQLLNAFSPDNKTSTMEYLCDSIRYILLSGFRIEASTAVNATCMAAGVQQNPRPEGAIAKIDRNATDAYQNAASILYAFMFASSAQTDSQLNVFCAHASNHVTRPTELKLNGTLVQETICNIKAPLSTDTATSLLKTWSSRVFATIIRNASNVGGWHARLCGNLDPKAMEAVGLDGQAVKIELCSGVEGSR